MEWQPRQGLACQTWMFGAVKVIIGGDTCCVLPGLRGWWTKLLAKEVSYVWRRCRAVQHP